MSLTTDRNDPELTHGVDTEPVPQAAKYLILSEEERAKGFVRPVRRSYTHVGPPGPKYPLRDPVGDEATRYYGDIVIVRMEDYPPEEDPVVGRSWTQAQLDAVGKGCGATTTMALALAETYARDPLFYGGTYCATCRKHLRVEEFVWDDGSGERVGS